MTSDEAKKMLVDFLKENRIDQKDFAKMIGKTEATISRWINGNKPLCETNINAIRFIVGMTPKKEKQEPKDSEPSDGIFSELTQIWPKLAQSEKARVLAYASELLEKSGYAVHSQFLDKNERKACS